MIMETERLFICAGWDSPTLVPCAEYCRMKRRCMHMRSLTDQEVQDWLERQLARYEKVGFRPVGGHT